MNLRHSSRGQCTLPADYERPAPAFHDATISLLWSTPILSVELGDDVPVEELSAAILRGYREYLAGRGLDVSAAAATGRTTAEGSARRGRPATPPTGRLTEGSASRKRRRRRTRPACGRM